MNKSEFVTFIAEKNNCTKVEAEKTIDIFTNAVVEIIGKGEEISLVGFGNFSISAVAARNGRNPSTGEALKIAAYNLPKFKAGQKLKDAANGRKPDDNKDGNNNLRKNKNKNDKKDSNKENKTVSGDKNKKHSAKINTKTKAKDK